MKESRCFFRFLEIGVISFEYREIGERYAIYVSSLTNKQTNKQRKLKGGRCFFRFLDFGVISFEYRERKKKETP